MQFLPNYIDLRLLSFLLAVKLSQTSFRYLWKFYKLEFQGIVYFAGIIGWKLRWLWFISHKIIMRHEPSATNLLFRGLCSCRYCSPTDRSVVEIAPCNTFTKTYLLSFIS